MSDNWTPRSDSRWSSERERARREAGEPEPTQQPESPPVESSFQVPATRPGGRHRVGNRAARSSRAGSDGSPTPAPSTTSRSGVRTVPSAEAGDGAGTPGGRLPDLPGGQGGSGGSRNNRVLILGALLFLGMAAFAVLPRLLDDDTGAPPSPTPELIQTPTPAPDEQTTTPTPPGAASDAEHLVCIDPGHGGWDYGWEREANSRAPAILEKEINLGMAWMLKERLEDRGIGVVMTRTSGLAANVFNEDVNGDGETIQDSDQAGDRDELQARIDVCNEAGADLLISLHLNGFDNTAVRGYEVLYTNAPYREFGDRNADLSNYLYREIGAAYAEAGFDTDARGVIPDDRLDVEMHEFGSERHLIMTGPAIENADYTIEPSAMPGAIVEAVFISNDDDAAFIALPENQELVVEAYARGIVTYFEQYPEAP